MDFVQKILRHITNLNRNLSYTILAVACMTFIFTEINIYAENDNENCISEFNEKVYLQLHKNVFIAGDDIFDEYLTNCTA